MDPENIFPARYPSDTAPLWAELLDGIRTMRHTIQAGKAVADEFERQLNKARAELRKRDKEISGLKARLETKEKELERVLPLSEGTNVLRTLMYDIYGVKPSGKGLEHDWNAILDVWKTAQGHDEQSGVDGIPKAA